MYVTRPLSTYRKDPNLLSLQPSDGPNSGFLVCTNEETQAEDMCCWGMCSDNRVKQFPFPQNKILNVVYTTGAGENQHTETHKVLFIPVLDKPLSSNLYYVIRAQGKHKGLACKCSREEDMGTCFCCNYVKNVKPSSFNLSDIYQQVEIVPRRYGFCAKAFAPDGFPPSFLRRKGWTVATSNKFQGELDEALGLDFSLRMQLPGLNFPISNKLSSSNVVGKWYCPFVFIKEEEPLKDQMKKSMFYEMKLEQWWEKIYTCENDIGNNNVVVNASVKKEIASLYGVEAVKDTTRGVDGFIWYRNVDKKDGKGLSLGLSLAIAEKMRWVEEVGGWSEGVEKYEKVERIEEFEGGKEWKRFGCFVLVERFLLRRMDGTLVLTNDFRHIHQIKNKWE